MNPEEESDREVLAHLTRLDDKMRAIECSPLTLTKLGGPAANGPAICREDPLDQQLLRSSLRSLLLTGSVKDLPERHQRRPEVVARLAAASPEVDFAVYGMTERLGGMTEAELAEIQERLRADPKAASGVADRLAEEAQAMGIPLSRRLHFRRLINHVVWRLQNQPASLLIDEYTQKVVRHTRQIEKQIARDPGLSRHLLASPAEAARWKALTMQVSARSQSEDDPAAAESAAELEAPAASTPPPVTDPKTERRRRRARPLMIAGASLMGAGVGVMALGVGLLFSPVGIAGAFVMTAAGVLLVTGMILLIVGAVFRKKTA